MAFDPKLRTFTFGKRAVPFDSVELRRLRAKGDGQFRRWMLTVRVSDRQVVLGTTSPLQKRELEAVAAHIAQMLPRPGGDPPQHEPNMVIPRGHGPRRAAPRMMVFCPTSRTPGHSEIGRQGSLAGAEARS